MPTWSTEDTVKIILLSLFIGAFYFAIQQLLKAEARMTANANANANKDKVSSGGDGDGTGGEKQD